MSGSAVLERVRIVRGRDDQHRAADFRQLGFHDVARHDPMSLHGLRPGLERIYDEAIQQVDIALWVIVG